MLVTAAAAAAVVALALHTHPRNKRYTVSQPVE